VRKPVENTTDNNITGYECSILKPKTKPKAKSNPNAPTSLVENNLLRNRCYEDDTD